MPQCDTQKIKFDLVIRKYSNKKAVRNLLLGMPGIYILYHREKCLYVGATKYLYPRSLRFFKEPSYESCQNFYIKAIMTAISRSESHMNLLKLGIKFMENCSVKELSDAEQFFIKECQPISNCSNRKYKKYQWN